PVTVPERVMGSGTSEEVCYSSHARFMRIAMRTARPCMPRAMSLALALRLLPKSRPLREAAHLLRHARLRSVEPEPRPPIPVHRDLHLLAALDELEVVL